MKKVPILACLLFCLSALQLSAQNSTRDSIIRIAKSDARKTSLTAPQKARFKAGGQNPNSDLFKPGPATVSNTALLNDSVYCYAYRQTAYKKARTHTVGHYFLIGGIVITAIYIAGIIAFVSTFGKGG